MTRRRNGGNFTVPLKLAPIVLQIVHVVFGANTYWPSIENTVYDQPIQKIKKIISTTVTNKELE